MSVVYIAIEVDDNDDAHGEFEVWYTYLELPDGLRTIGFSWGDLA